MTYQARPTLQAGITAYKDGTWFTTDVYNWNLVCNGGLLAGAIAFSDAPKTQAAAASVFRNATHDIPIGLSSFGPDGGWPEGTTYWGYVVTPCPALLLCAVFAVRDWAHTCDQHLW